MTANPATIIILALTALIAAGCDNGVEMDVMNNGSLASVAQTSFDPTLLCSDISYENEAGETITGTRDCSQVKPACRAVGDTDCYIGDTSLYGMDPSDLTAENLKVGVEVNGVTGTYVTKDDVCTAEGQRNCVATGAFPAALVADIKAKVIFGQAVGSHQGQMVPDLPYPANVAAGHSTGGSAGTFALCSATRSSNCVVTAAQKATPPATITAGDIKLGETIAGVAGSFESSASNCAADGGTGCVARAGFAALDRSNLLGTNLETGYTLLAVPGTVTARPADCGADGATGCVAEARFGAIDRSGLAAGIIRAGVTIGGVTGAYPSAAFPLAGALPAITDLSQSSFAGAIAAAAPFEFFNAAGERFQVAGSSALVPANVLSGTEILGVSGALTASPSACSGDNGIGCVAGAGFPAINKANLSAGAIRSGVTIAGITGQYPSAAHPLPGLGGHTPLNYPANLGGSHTLVFWDAAGNAHTAAAAADLAAGHILSGVTIFAVPGSATAAPSACTAHNQLGCVADSSYPSYELASVDSKVLKNGATFTTPAATITGVYPSASAPLEAPAGVTRLTAANFNSSLASPAAFEFWDASGQKHTAQGDADLTAANIRAGTNLFGVAGTTNERPSDCTTAALGCVTTASRPSYDPAVIRADVIRSGTVIGAVTGTYPSASAPLNGASATDDLTAGSLNSRLAGNGSFEYWDASGQRYTAQGDADLAQLNQIRSGTTIFGQTGTTVHAPADCQNELENGCVIAGGFRSVDQTKIDAAHIKAGVAILGTTGTYPSAANPLPGASVTADLTAAGYNGAMASNDSFEFWDASGVRRTGSGSATLTAANLKAGVSFAGVTGTLATTKGNCTASGETGCTAHAGYPSYELSALTPAVVKNGTVVLGVTGAYPSASHPLASGGNPRLASGFNSALQSDSSFEFWDESGQRITAQGDSDLVAANIRRNTTIFGVTGSQFPAPELDPWDVVYGVNYQDAQGNNKTGKLKLSCANQFDSSATIEGPVSVDRRLHTIDDWNNGRNRMPNLNRFAPDAAYVCNGDAFEDISFDKDTFARAPCNPGSLDKVTCLYKDRIADLEWLQLDSSSESRRTYSNAVSKCENLTAGGHSDWRLPTQKEAIMAYVHGIRSLSLLSGHSGIFRMPSYTWTNTVDSTDSGKAYAVEMAQGLVSRVAKTAISYAHCVRQSRNLP